VPEFVFDTFTDTDTTLLENHTPETGGPWSKQTGHSGSFIIEANRAWATEAAYRAAGEPATADYTVTATVFVTT
jgi:hypothetical protein